MLGNALPHVHTHVVPRYLDDAQPGRPIDPAGPTVEAEDFIRQVELLRAACAPDGATEAWR